MTTVGFYFPLDKEDTNALRRRLNAVAQSFGYYAERGPTAGEGCLTEMLMAIDVGELALVLLPDEHFAPAIAHLESLNEEWADAIAIGLRAALIRQAEADQAEIDEYRAGQ